VFSSSKYSSSFFLAPAANRSVLPFEITARFVRLSLPLDSQLYPQFRKPIFLQSVILVFMSLFFQPQNCSASFGAISKNSWNTVRGRHVYRALRWPAAEAVETVNTARSWSENEGCGLTGAKRFVAITAQEFRFCGDLHRTT
jgi:hypothetical protein